jgi:hypothetical protein
MDAFELGALMRKHHIDAIKTTKDIQVCSPENLPEKPKGIRLGHTNKHLDSGLCVMLHNVGEGSILEVRGYDEDGEEFSYKFHYTLGQSVAMRAISNGGEAQKLLVSLEDKKASGIKLHQK